MTRSLPVAGALTALLGLAAVTVALGADIRSPHGREDACFQCHEPTTDGAIAEDMTFVGGGPNAACQSCHEDDPHEIGLEARRAKVPEDMLLLRGRLACFTCHDEPACDSDKVSEDDPYFMRGGPYASVGGLCARCHEVTGTERFNPHRAMADRPDDPQMCEHCHLEAPAPDATEADLKIDGPNICLGCHPESPHAGAETHLGPIPPSMQKTVRRSGLPITAHQEIVCLTCHDPHPGHILQRSAQQAEGVGKELFPDRWLHTVLEPSLADRGDLQPKHTDPDFLRKSLQGGELCRSCHTPQAIEALREERR